MDYVVPHRITDGYGINEHLIDNAAAEGKDTILTCDNGIAAIPQIQYAKEQGLTVIVTDHHDIPFTEENGRKETADVLRRCNSRPETAGLCISV